MKKNNTWNIRRLVDDSFVPSSKGLSVLYCKLTDLWTLSHQSRDQKMLNLLSICKDTTMRQERILIGVLNTKLLILEIIGPTLEFVFFFSNRDGKLWGILVLQTTKQQCTKKLFFTRVSLMSWD